MKNRRFISSVPVVATTFCFLSSQTGSLVVRSDTDSDHLKDESKPTLDSLVAAARTQPSWKFAVEGYTDNTGGEGPQPDALRKAREFSQSLLGDAGVDINRLTTQGFGASKPVSSNDTALGRSQNRWVEIVKR